MDTKLVYKKYLVCRGCGKYGCENKINRGKNGFHCGHIVSEFNGGKTIIENLRPVCFNCNSNMNTTNWLDYEKKLKKHLDKIIKNY